MGASVLSEPVTIWTSVSICPAPPINFYTLALPPTFYSTSVINVGFHNPSSRDNTGEDLIATEVEYCLDDTAAGESVSCQVTNVTSSNQLLVTGLEHSRRYSFVARSYNRVGVSHGLGLKRRTTRPSPLTYSLIHSLISNAARLSQPARSLSHLP